MEPIKPTIPLIEEPPSDDDGENVNVNLLQEPLNVGGDEAGGINMAAIIAMDSMEEARLSGEPLSDVGKDALLNSAPLERDADQPVWEIQLEAEKMTAGVNLAALTMAMDAERDVIMQRVVGIYGTAKEAGASSEEAARIAWDTINESLICGRPVEELGRIPANDVEAGELIYQLRPSMDQMMLLIGEATAKQRRPATRRSGRKPVTKKETSAQVKRGRGAAAKGGKVTKAKKQQKRAKAGGGRKGAGRRSRTIHGQ